MAYLVARCPMLGCNHRNVICDLHTESLPAFQPGIYVAVKCGNCGESFREPVMQLELSQLGEEVPATAQHGLCAGPSAG